jgi:hypothetical protein
MSFLGKVFGGAVSGGNKTDIKNKTTVNKSFESNQKINRSMAVESITKLVNNVASDVIQKNSASAASAASASNVLWLQNVNCDDVVISGVVQKSAVDNTTVVKSQQQNMSKIANEISTSIDKTIEKVGATDLEALEAENSKTLNSFMKEMPGYDPNKAHDMASQCPKSSDSLISIGNTCNVSNEYELNASVKKALDLDESFKIKDEDNVSNDIKNKVEQSNFASCEASASASNAIILSDITCGAMNAMNKAQAQEKAEASGKKLSPAKRGRLEISDIEQQAIAQLYMTCIFDQKNVSEVANKIMNKISKKYSQVYDAVKEKAKKMGPEYEANAFKFLDIWSAAGMEKIAAAAGNLPKAQPKPKEETIKEVEKTPDSKDTKEKTTEIKDEVTRSPNFSSELPEIKRKPLVLDDNKTPKELERKAKYAAEREATAKRLAAEDAAEKKAIADQAAAERKAIADKAAAAKAAKAASDKAVSDKAASSKQPSKQIPKAEEAAPNYLLYGIIGVVALIIIIVIISMTGSDKPNPRMMPNMMPMQMRR